MSGYPVPPAQPSSRGRGGARVAETPKSVLLEPVSYTHLTLPTILRV